LNKNRTQLRRGALIGDKFDKIGASLEHYRRKSPRQGTAERVSKVPARTAIKLLKMKSYKRKVL
jgi:hypothetical protein